LQVWVELGVLGALLYVALSLYLLYSCRQAAGAAAQRMALASFLATLCMANIGYGLWQGWQLGLFLFLGGLVVFTARMQAARQASWAGKSSTAPAISSSPPAPRRHRHVPRIH